MERLRQEPPIIVADHNDRHVTRSADLAGNPPCLTRTSLATPGHVRDPTSDCALPVDLARKHLERDPITAGTALRASNFGTAMHADRLTGFGPRRFRIRD
jgi:hypothetical protein